MRTIIKIAVFSAIFGISAWGQAGSTSQVSGVVQDSSGLAIVGAEVKITQTATGVVRTAASGADGTYVLPNLPVGPYQLEVTKEGFSKYVQSGIVLQVDTSPKIDATLKVGSVTEQVVVQANAAMVETRSTGIGQVVDNQRIVDLPLNGRQATELILLAGAATQGVNGDTIAVGKNYPVAQISVAGGLSQGMSYLLDGGSHNDPINSLNLPLPFPDALQEFKVETSALPAQYGQHSAAAVNAVTKSGSNEWHGDAFEFVRNAYFNARNFFAVRRDTLKRNQFGGVIGGPVKKNKIFFFAGFQNTLQHTDAVDALTFVPTADMLAGDFTTFASPTCNGGRQVALKAPFVGNKITPALTSPAGLNLANRLPRTADPCGAIRWGVARTQSEPQGVAKVDYQVTDRHSVFGRYWATNLVVPQAQGGQQNPLYGTQSGQNSHVQSLVFGDTYIFGAGTISSFRVTGNRQVTERIPVDMFSPSDLGVKMYTVPLPIPQTTNLAITGGATIGATSAIPGLFPTVAYQISEDIGLVRGAHQIAFGMNYIHSALNSTTYSYTNGQITISSGTTGLGYGDLFAGAVNTFRQDRVTHWAPRHHYIGLYLQDSWRMSSRLTVNYGVRWEPFIPVTVAKDYVSIFQQDWFLKGTKSNAWVNAPSGVLFPGDKTPDGLVLPSHVSYSKKANFAPRLGLVWDPMGNGRMTVRAAYGIFYDLPNIYWSSNIEHQAPWGYLLSLSGVKLDDPYASYPGGNPFPGVIDRNAPFPAYGQFYNTKLHPKPPYMHQWNLSVQRQIGSDWLVSANYLGTSLLHMWGTVDANPGIFIPGSNCVIGSAFYATCSSTSNINQRRLLSLLNPAQGQFYSSLFALDDGETQSYHGLLLSVQRRLSKGVTIQGNYTWSHCIGDVQNYELTGPNYSQISNRAYDRGNCDLIDKRHILNFSAVAESPRFAGRFTRMLASGWRLSGIVKYQSSSYFSVISGADTQLSGQTNERPNQVLENPYGARTVDSWLNPAAFSPAGNGTTGNICADNLTGPGRFTIDTGLSRAFAIRERQRFEIRGEAFNLQNRANFSAPTATLSSGSFGKITAAGDPRIMQFAVKYVF